MLKYFCILPNEKCVYVYFCVSIYKSYIHVYIIIYDITEHIHFTIIYKGLTIMFIEKYLHNSATVVLLVIHVLLLVFSPHQYKMFSTLCSLVRLVRSILSDRYLDGYCTMSPT